jgi:hypothetical protein
VQSWLIKEHRNQLQEVVRMAPVLAAGAAVAEEDSDVAVGASAIARTVVAVVTAGAVADVAAMATRRSGCR